ncbi:MAG: GDP-mannose 4,6-dehydratase [Leptothrix ochracea]|uniref:GDP-mannose 4,6-dehydratase n=1 Tax=Leptothrix ochracea TaxID=735331 RepID=UPI0034E1F3D7
MQERVLITGILGQDGAYLARHLLDLGHDVIGLGREFDDPARLWRLRYLGVHDQVRLVELDLDTRGNDVLTRIAALRPDRIIHLAAQSSVARSFAEPLLTAESAGMGAVRIFEAARQLGGVPVVQPSSAEILDLQGQTHIDAHTPIGAQSPYGAAKAFAHLMARVYRQSMATPISTAILFNHESPLRGDAFVTRKIVRELVRIRRELDAGVTQPAPLRLGKLDALRDWSHARDIVQGLWLIAQHPQAGDHVLASGRLHSVRDFVSLTAAHVGLDMVWEGQGLDEVGRCPRNGHVWVSVDPAFYRPTDPDQMPVDLRSTIEALHWQPTPSLAPLIAEMCDFELTMNGRNAP